MVMDKFKIEFNLPTFAFVEGSGHEKKDMLTGRTVILHVRSASVIEIFNREKVALNPEVFTYKFIYTNQFGIQEPLIAVLHYCATLDVNEDGDMIKNEVIKPAAQWYCEYCTWEDRNIARKEGLND